jgi:hypothetical protein
MTHAAAHIIDKSGLSSELITLLLEARRHSLNLCSAINIVVVVYVNGTGRVGKYRFVKRWVAMTAATGLSHKLSSLLTSIGPTAISLLFWFPCSPHLHWQAWAYRACQIGPSATVPSPLIRFKDDAINAPCTLISWTYPCHCSCFRQLDHCGDSCFCYRCSFSSIILLEHSGANS